MFDMYYYHHDDTYTQELTQSQQSSKRLFLIAADLGSAESTGVGLFGHILRYSPAQQARRILPLSHQLLRMITLQLDDPGQACNNAGSVRVRAIIVQINAAPDPLATDNFF